MSASSESPLSEEHRRALVEARTELGRLLRAARFASLTVSTLVLFGGLTIAWGLLSGGGGLVIGFALLAVAWNEGRGRDRYRALDPDGARILGWNQLILAAVVTLYCLSVMWRAGANPDPAMQEIEEILGVSADIVAELTRLVYGGVIVGVCVAQALLARYYFVRGPRMREFLNRTPPWIRDVLAEE